MWKTENYLPKVYGWKQRRSLQIYTAQYHCCEVYCECLLVEGGIKSGEQNALRLDCLLASVLLLSHPVVSPHYQLFMHCNLSVGSTRASPVAKSCNYNSRTKRSCYRGTNMLVCFPSRRISGPHVCFFQVGWALRIRLGVRLLRVYVQFGSIQVFTTKSK